MRAGGGATSRGAGGGRDPGLMGTGGGVSTADSARSLPATCARRRRTRGGRRGNGASPGRAAPGRGGEGGGDKDARSPPGLWLDLRRLPQRHCSICEPFSRRSPRILMDFTLWRPPAPRKRDRPRSGRLSAAGRRPLSPPNFPAHRRARGRVGDPAGTSRDFSAGGGQALPGSGSGQLEGRQALETGAAGSQPCPLPAQPPPGRRASAGTPPPAAARLGRAAPLVQTLAVFPRSSLRRCGEPGPAVLHGSAVLKLSDSRRAERKGGRRPAPLPRRGCSPGQGRLDADIPSDGRHHVQGAPNPAFPGLPAWQKPRDLQRGWDEDTPLVLNHQ